MAVLILVLIQLELPAAERWSGTLVVSERQQDESVAQRIYRCERLPLAPGQRLDGQMSVVAPSGRLEVTGQGAEVRTPDGDVIETIALAPIPARPTGMRLDPRSETRLGVSVQRVRYQYAGVQVDALVATALPNIYAFGLVGRHQDGDVLVALAVAPGLPFEATLSRGGQEVAVQVVSLVSGLE